MLSFQSPEDLPANRPAGCWKSASSAELKIQRFETEIGLPFLHTVQAFVGRRTLAILRGSELEKDSAEQTV
jgi:hypothetical protein